MTVRFVMNDPMNADAAQNYRTVQQASSGPLGSDRVHASQGAWIMSTRLLLAKAAGPLGKISS